MFGLLTVLFTEACSTSISAHRQMITFSSKPTAVFSQPHRECPDQNWASVHHLPKPYEIAMEEKHIDERPGAEAARTWTKVICEPRARRIFSVLVGYGLSLCLYSHCFRGRAISCRACLLCRTFPPF